MGEVWLAEQLRPLRRHVAIKVIKAGMDTARVIARFDAERQALAVMDHPTIAKVFDGGKTPEGRPYFAMEYVRGEAITGLPQSTAAHDPRAARTLHPSVRGCPTCTSKRNHSSRLEALERARVRD